MTYKLKNLRDKAAEGVLRRIREGRGTHPRRSAPLARMERRIFDPDFDVAAMWREAGVRDHGASTWFRGLEPSTPAAYRAASFRGTRTERAEDRRRATTSRVISILLRAGSREFASSTWPWRSARLLTPRTSGRRLR